jgi:hypothetical protein
MCALPSRIITLRICVDPCTFVLVSGIVKAKGLVYVETNEYGHEIST